MVSPERKVVYVVGTAPAGLAGTLQRRALELQSGAVASQLAAAVPSEMRAVLLPMEQLPKLRKSIIELYDAILDRGALLAVLLPNENTQRDDRARAVQILTTIPDRNVGLTDLQTDPRILAGWAPEEVAQACVNYDPGPFEDIDLRINDLDTPVHLSTTESILLRRALKGYDRIAIGELGGSYGESRVLRIDANQGDRISAPYVAKIGSREDINRELDQIADYVLETIPFPNYPPVVEERCVVGAAKRLMLSRMVDRAQRFDKFVSSAKSDNELRRALDLLFSGAFHLLRGNLSEAQKGLGAWYFDQKIIPHDLHRLTDPYSYSASRDGSIGDPVFLVEGLKAFPPIQFKLSLAHGDLHVRNLFARLHPISNALIDVVVIDFSSVRMRSPISRDLATLEVSLALDDLPDVPRLPSAILDAWFSGSLLERGRLPVNSRRLVAIDAVRNRARLEHISLAEYRISLIAYFIRLAKLERVALERRADAYRLAWRLALEAESQFSDSE